MLDATPMHHDGVGGVGMVTFGELAHMVDATQLLCISAIGHMVDATQLLCISAIAHMVDATQLGRTRKVAVTKRKRPTVLLLVHGVKTCQVQLASDFGKTPKVPVLPRGNARF